MHVLHFLAFFWYHLKKELRSLERAIALVFRPGYDSTNSHQTRMSNQTPSDTATYTLISKYNVTHIIINVEGWSHCHA